MNTLRIGAVALAALLAGCGGQSHQDLREWMSEQGKGVKGRLDPLPTIRPYEPFAYNAFDLPDPFKPRKVESKGGKLAPDLTRRREPLESFPLESLAMVGTIEKGRALYALVKTPEKDIYQVRQGNYMGQNYGVVIGISDSDIKLKELVQDGAGDWTERSSALNLLPSELKAGSKR
jgi:type IV pilus assembly protein PilP